MVVKVNDFAAVGAQSDRPDLISISIDPVVQMEFRRLPPKDALVHVSQRSLRPDYRTGNRSTVDRQNQDHPDYCGSPFGHMFPFHFHLWENKVLSPLNQAKRISPNRGNNYLGMVG